MSRPILDLWRQFLLLPGNSGGMTQDLQTFADGVFRGEYVPSLDTALFNLTGVADHPLTLPQRDRLWRAFHVPVYEVLFDEHAGLLASECEAH